jgi:hypothetical protein
MNMNGFRRFFSNIQHPCAHGSAAARVEVTANLMRQLQPLRVLLPCNYPIEKFGPATFCATRSIVLRRGASSPQRARQLKLHGSACFQMRIYFFLIIARVTSE